MESVWRGRVFHLCPGCGFRYDIDSRRHNLLMFLAALQADKGADADFPGINEFCLAIFQVKVAEDILLRLKSFHIDGFFNRDLSFHIVDWPEIIGGGIEQGELEQAPDMYLFLGRGHGGYLDFPLQFDDFVDVRLGVGHIDILFQRYLYVSPADNIL